MEFCRAGLRFPISSVEDSVIFVARWTPSRFREGGKNGILRARFEVSNFKSRFLFRILWQGGHPLGSERVGKDGILLDKFEVSDFRCRG